MDEAEDLAEGSKTGDYSELLEDVIARETELRDKWGKDAGQFWELYSGRQRDTPFNILFSNTEIIVPAVFSRKPIPKVCRRFDEARADLPAKAMNRMLSFCMDTNLGSFPDFMTAVEDSVLDCALVGQGQARVRKVDGLAVLDYVNWKKFIWGYCERWEDCPWVAFRHDLTYQDAVSVLQLSESAAKSLKQKMGDGSTQDNAEDGTKEKKPTTIAVYELWDKRKRTVHWLCSEADSSCFHEEPDPLQLQNFYPIPSKPLTFVHSTTDTLPRPLYNLYKTQAEELNEITRRLGKIIKAMKVRGIYAGQIPEIPRLFEEDETTIIPAETASQIMAMQGKGLDAYIWMLPIEKLIVVAKELYSAREQVKGVIYEILGIGDILRGVSKASETLGAQELKDKWGSLRVNRARERTAEFIRACLRLMAEVSAKHTDPQMWEQITGMGLKPPMEAAALQSPVPGQPAPPVDPMQTWPGVLQVLQNDLTRAYTIDVETNSTVDSEATTEKQETAEFMNAFGQAMAGLKDLMTTPEGFEAGKTILIGITSKFRLGEDVEPLLRAIKPPQGGMSPEMQKVQQDLEKRAAEMDKREQGAQQQEQLIKDLMTEIKTAQDALKQQEDQLALRREQQRRDEDASMASIENAKREAVLEIKEEQLTLKNLKSDVLTQKAMLEAKRAARPQPQAKGGQ